jgi:ERCC4-related helicase
VVLYNFYRWFPQGKVIFMAPTLPLDTQQVTACYRIMGIPEYDTAVVNGKTLPSHRARIWRDRPVFHKTRLDGKVSQKVVIALRISKIEARGGDNADAKKYTDVTKIEMVLV